MTKRKRRKVTRRKVTQKKVTRRDTRNNNGKRVKALKEYMKVTGRTFGEALEETKGLSPAMIKLATKSKREAKKPVYYGKKPGFLDRYFFRVKYGGPY